MENKTFTPLGTVAGVKIIDMHTNTEIKGATFEKVTEDHYVLTIPKHRIKKPRISTRLF